jgi:Tol biopolymer transport system component
MKRILTLLLPLLFCGALFAKDAPTHESIWMMKRVGSPALSPDGRSVIVSVNEYSYDEKEQSSDLWIVPADGSAAPRRITFNKATESEVTWSPDSRRIAFSSKRESDDANQIYILDIANGGEAQRVTNSATGARTPRFRPDGNAILYSTITWPGASDEESNRKLAKEHKDAKAHVRIFDSYPVRMWDRWLDESQIHLVAQPLTAGAKGRDLLAGTNLIKEPGFAGRGAEGSREEINAAWTPDGSSIVFTATTGRNTSAYQEHVQDIYRTSQNGGEPERIAHSTGSYGRLAFSPDGKTLYTSFSESNEKVYTLSRLVAFDWPSMNNRRVVTAPPFDRSVGGFEITPDSKTIYFTAEDAGLEKIYSVPAAGGEVKLAVDAERGVYTDLAIAEKSCASIRRRRRGRTSHRSTSTPHRRSTGSRHSTSGSHHRAAKRFTTCSSCRPASTRRRSIRFSS